VKAAPWVLGLVLPVVAALLSAAPGPSQSPPAYKESSFATDPLWEGVGNRLRACTRRSFSFGWMAPSRTWPTGAIGGRLDRATDFRAYYAEALPEPRTLDDGLTASGMLQVDGLSRGGALFGWFNSADSYDWRTADFLGLRLDRIGRGVVAYGEYGTRNTFTETTDPVRFSARRAVAWTLQYLPDEGVDSAGLVRLIVGNRKVEVSLKAAHRTDGATFDRFGLLNDQVEGPSLTVTFANLTLDNGPIDLSRDPAWDGSNNRLAGASDCVVHDHHDFGYAAGIALAGDPGAIGGLVWRSQHGRAYYGDPIETVGLDDQLYAAGSIELESASSDADTFIGWFSDRSVRKGGDLPTNLVGADLGGPSEWGTRLYPVYHSGGSLGGGYAPLGLIDPSTFDPLAFDRFADTPLVTKHHLWHFWLCYRPNTDGVGNGRLFVGLEDPAGLLSGARVSISVKKAARDEHAVLNRFGIRAFETGGHSLIFYLDDLRYTSGPGDVGPDERCTPSST